MGEKLIYVAKDTLPPEHFKIVFEHLSRLEKRNYNAVLLYVTGSDQANLKASFPINYFKYEEYAKLLQAIKSEEGIKVATDWLTAFFVSKASNGKNAFYLVMDIETKYAMNFAEARAVFKAYELDLKIVATSAWAKDQLKKIYGYDVILVPPGIDEKVFYPRKAKRDAKKIIYIEQPYFWTAREVFAKAIEYAFERNPELTLTTVSANPPPHYGNIPHSHEYVSNEKDMAKLYSSATCFVSSSNHESFGLPLLEAMACGCCVVTTKADGNEGFCKDGFNCLAVEKNNPEALGKAILRIFEDKDLREKLIKNGQQTAKEFSWDESMSKLEKIFRESD